ncbi:KilA-N domain-containing protein [Marinomonas sp. IMCC 4694]|uniref:KilA-N domain-containing protein n=1 Tax=Marinomonas sp. IMCC 4694 TaxID=2605432 RepID=UPI0011E70DF0|nr:KilA-N domain-containing protein [Marinomonas sp. IMCC 4694]TYL47166.1 KilA-N domain-containing protein [Marinomonas sp. IMCC 4694]
MASKNKVVSILGESITITDDDYISLTNMLKVKEGDFFISDWLRNRNTVEYLGIWERIHNPDFNYGEFATIKSLEQK